MGWHQDAIGNLFDQEASASLAYELVSLRTPFDLSKSGESPEEFYRYRHNYPKTYTTVAAEYEQQRTSALNKSWLNFFPEEDEEIGRLLSKYDRYLPIKDLPAVNGLTEEFWG
jgi:hypothetical protein